MSDSTESDGRVDERRRLALPGFVPSEPVGLGDVIKRATTAVGIRPCGGCERRAERLNRLAIASPRSSRRS